MSRRLGAGALGAGRWGSGTRWRAEQTGRAAGRARERQARRAAGERAAGARARGSCVAGRAAGALLGALSSRGTGAVRAAMHGLGVAWCAGWASWGLMQPVWFLTWVFDSGVFLSHRMDSVHEQCL